MSASDVEIANFALGHLGSSVDITSFAERSAEARAATKWYAQTRDELLRDFAWPWALARTSLALVATQPNDEWGYSYTAPSGFLRLVRAPYGSTRNPTLDTTTKYTVEGDLLYMDQQFGSILYVQQITDTSKFPPDFAMALSYLMAARMAPALVKENSGQKALTMFTLSERYAAKAKANALNEQAADIEPEPGLISSRA